jgi:hypothetical protein
VAPPTQNARLTQSVRRGRRALLRFLSVRAVPVRTSLSALTGTNVVVSLFAGYSVCTINLLGIGTSLKGEKVALVSDMWHLIKAN